MNKDKILQTYRTMCAIQTDINEHLPVLRKYASRCEHITEMGVRKVFSTWGFLAGLVDRGGGTLHSIDWTHPQNSGGHGTGLYPIYEVCGGKEIEFTFLQADTLKIDIPKTDLLFIDTNHVYKQLKEELKLHSPKVEKYIICHDTESCKEELGPALKEFLESNEEWKMIENLVNNEGLTVLERNTIKREN